MKISLNQIDQINSLSHELVKKPDSDTGIKVVTDIVNLLKKVVNDNEIDGASNGVQTHNHLVCKWTLNHLAKLAYLDTAPVSNKEFLDIHATNRVQVHSETRIWLDNNIQ